MNAPLISVIVPVYNTAKYLRKCLDSICGQTYCNLEILCVNDGSTDDSAAILEEYAAKDDRVKVISQQNAGLSAARNAALDVAEGEWVTGVDSDDYLEPDAYEYAINHAAEEDDIVIFEVKEELETSDTELRFLHSNRRGAQPPTTETLLHTDVAFWNKLWRRSFVEKSKVRFPYGLLFEDGYFWFALAPYARQIRNLPEAKYHYVLRASGIMGQTFQGTARAFDQILITEKILEHYRQYPLPGDMRALTVEVLKLHYSITKYNVTEEHYTSLLEKARELAHRYSLYDRCPGVLNFLRPGSKWTRFFSTHLMRKSSYGFGPLKLLTISYKNGYKICRFLGIKLYKKKY